METSAIRVREALERGLTRSELDRRWHAPHWGIRTRVAVTTLEGRCASLLPRLPAGTRFSHATAALLLGLPLPRRLESHEQLHVATPRGHRAVDAAGVAGHELRLRPDDCCTVGGLPVTSATRTLRDLAAHLAIPDLLALADAAVARDRPLATINELRQATTRARRYRGRLRALEAVALVSDRAESRPESLLRFALVSAGLPPLSVNVDIHDKGRFVARPDLRFTGYPLIVEYEGRQHALDERQWARDLERYAQLDDLGMRVIRASATDLPHFERTVARATAALRALGWSPHR